MTGNTNAVLFYCGDTKMSNKIILGIDVSKSSLSLALRLQNGKFYEKTVLNSSTGFKSILKFLNLKRIDKNNLECIMESTGSYSEAIANFLYENGINTKVVNPYKIASFAKSKLSRIKTDKTDAKLIAEYGLISNNDKFYKKPPEALGKIRILYRTYLAQTKLSSISKNHLENTNDVDEQVFWLETIKVFEINRKKIIQKIIEIINSDEILSKQFKNLKTIPGVAEITAIAIFSEIQSVEKFDSARQLAAYCGVTPKIYESGTSVHKKSHISKSGNKILRKALYLPAITAINHCKECKHYTEQLLKRGKCKKQAIIAIMKKILLASYAILKNNSIFNPKLLFIFSS